MDPAACRVVYIDRRFNTERWITRDGFTPPTPQRATSHTEFSELPLDLQANVNAFLSVFNQVFVCHSGRSFSTKLSELHDQVKIDCTPIIACFDVGSESKHDHYVKSRPRFNPAADSPTPLSPILRREITFSSESDESYGLQLLSRIASDLQVEEGVKLIIPVGIVQPKRKDSYDQAQEHSAPSSIARAPYGIETAPVALEDKSDTIDPQVMLQCLDAGALDVVKSPLDKAGIMGLTVHAYRIYKKARKEQSGFMAQARRGRKQSWVGVEEEIPYAYLREAMVRKLLKGICEPQEVIEDFQHRDLYVEESRREIIAREVGTWGFCGHDFSEDELVYAGYYMLSHALTVPELERWRMPSAELVHFMQGCRVAYNSFVLYHNFRHAVDVLQSLFYFLVQIGTLPPYPIGSPPPPRSQDRSPVARLIGPFEALTLLISAIGHDVGHPGVNNMFLVKLNAPLAQLYNDQSVLEAFHCAAYSQILRRHWPAAFQDKAIRKLMISSILATDMGVHSDYMQQLGNLQEKIHETKVTDSWAPKDVDSFKVLTCGLLIKCADISNVARPWSVAEKWTHLLQQEFAHQGEMEQAVGMDTTLFGGPPELGNTLKLANGQIGFMTIFAHPLFANVADIIPAMSFAAEEILTNKGVWFTRAEQEKRMQKLRVGTRPNDGGAVSPRTQSPTGVGRKYFEKSSNAVTSPLRKESTPVEEHESNKSHGTGLGAARTGNTTPQNPSRRSSLAAVAAIVTPPEAGDSRRSSITSKSGQKLEGSRRRSSNTVTNGQRHLRDDELFPSQTNSGVATGSSENEDLKFRMPSPSSQGSLAEPDMRNDHRRDNATSMRAGSAAIPVEAMGSMNEEKGSSSPDALSKFTFATSNKDEPVRTYDPQQSFPAVRASARASVPVNDLDHQQEPVEFDEEAKQPASAQSEDNTTSTNLRGGAGEVNTLTPSHSTEATSYTSEKSEEFNRQQQTQDFEAKRHRATSAPMQMASPMLRPSFSMGSTNSGSRESSKQDVRTTIFSNGDVDEGETKERRSITKSIGRRRSRLKLGLAFWKKRGNDKGEKGEQEKTEGNEGEEVCRES